MGTSVAFLLSIAVLATAPNAKVCAGELLPSELKKIVARQFSGWRIVTVNDLHPDDQDIWMKTGGGDCPGIAIGHFETPKEVSYALLLMREEGSDLMIRLIVARRVGLSVFRTQELLRPKRTVRPSAIFRSPPGEVISRDRSQRAHAPLDVLTHELLEVGADAYYWRGGKYHSIRIYE